MTETLGKRVRERRQQQGLTIERLAFGSGISVRTIYRLEADEHSPTIATLSAVADVLGTTVSVLTAEPTEAAS